MSVRNISHLNGVYEKVLETQEFQWIRPDGVLFTSTVTFYRIEGNIPEHPKNILNPKNILIFFSQKLSLFFQSSLNNKVLRF